MEDILERRGSLEELMGLHPFILRKGGVVLLVVGVRSVRSQDPGGI